MAKKVGGNDYWKRVKVFSAFFGWTLQSQYRFPNLERLFFYCLQMALDFESFTYSADFSPNGISNNTQWRCSTPILSHFYINYLNDNRLFVLMYWAPYSGLQTFKENSPVAL